MTFLALYRAAWTAFHAGDLDECSRLYSEARAVRTNSQQTRRLAVLWGVLVPARSAAYASRCSAEVSP